MYEIVLHSGEVFERVYLNEPSLNIHITQEAGSRVKIHVLNLPSLNENTDSAVTVHNIISIEQQGQGCETHIYGLAHLLGTDRITTETHVLHAVGGGHSDQLVKFVLEQEAQGHFVGDLKIAQDAQQTDAHQTNRNLVLSNTAQMRAQPQLEIYADDVQATHGATTGQLDETQLFYMQQRGISKAHARQLLIGAFMKDIIQTIGDETLREQLIQQIDNAY